MKDFMNLELKIKLVILFVILVLSYFVYPRQTHYSKVGSIIKVHETECINDKCFCLLTNKRIGKYTNWSDTVVDKKLDYKGRCNNANNN